MYKTLCENVFHLTKPDQWPRFSGVAKPWRETQRN